MNKYIVTTSEDFDLEIEAEAFAQDGAGGLMLIKGGVDVAAFAPACWRSVILAEEVAR